MKKIIVLIFSIVTIFCSLDSFAVEIDESTGLIKADGWELVRNNCIACHSTKLVTQHHASRNKWQAIIVWMQETQGLQQFEDSTLDTILNYLSTNYGPKGKTRRSSLDPLLLPINPYKSPAQNATDEKN